MASKKTASDQPNEQKTGKQTESAPASELAAMVRGCKEQWSNVPILADWLEERLGLSATASLLRSPDLQPLAAELHYSDDFHYFPLAADVFVWLAGGHYWTDQIGFESKRGMVFGLYAHPEGRPGTWTKVVGIISLEKDREGDPQRPWERGVKKHPRVEDARNELVAFAKSRSNLPVVRAGC